MKLSAFSSITFITLICLFLLTFLFYTFENPTLRTQAPYYHSRHEARLSHTTSEAPNLPVVLPLTLQQLHDINVNRTFPVNYSDPNYAGDCTVTSPRQEMFALMKWWLAFSARHNIVWFLQYGTLIGAVRHNDVIPWDSDADIAIFQCDELLLRNLSTPRPITDYEKVNLVVRPDQHCPYNGARLNCNNQSVTRQTDGCAFCGPLARFFHHPNQRIDVYVVNREIPAKGGIMMMADEGMWEYSAEKAYYPLELYEPLVLCNWMNLTLFCPHKSKELLNKFYGNYSPNYICKNKNWIATPKS